MTEDYEETAEADEDELCRDIQMKLPDCLWQLDYVNRYRAGKFNEDFAALETGEGTLRLAGAQLNMTELDLEAGEAKFTGRIDTLEYTASAPAGGFLRRLLR